MFVLNHKIFIKKLMAAALTAALIIGGSIWQQHILQVQAAVQVLLVSHTAIPFGTMFPEENAEETYYVQLDTSVQSAVYATRTEPVPGKINLCPLLNLNPSDNPSENDTFATGHLSKPSDLTDNWRVSFNAPAIAGFVSQDHKGRIVVQAGDYECKIIITTETQTEFHGCTPGYWKQDQHFDSWRQPYDPSDSFVSAFNRTITISWSSQGKPKTVLSPSLLQSLEANGGGINALARHAVAALLNSANESVIYAYSTAEVISMTQGAIDSGNYEAVKNLFEAANQRSCPLN